MSRHFIREQIADKATIHETAPAGHEVDRTFELPRALYAITVGCYLGFLGITATAFSSPGLLIPMVIFAFFIVAGFGVPTIWTRLGPKRPSAAMTWGVFRRKGIMTHTGRLGGGEAAVQVLVLPVLIVLWGLAVATIAALV